MLNHRDKGGEKMKRCRRGQSVLEYVIVLTAIIAIIIAAATTVIRPAVTNVMNGAGNSITGAAGRLPF
jgi:Flp pilus assembly pilin Flp